MIELKEATYNYRESVGIMKVNLKLQKGQIIGVFGENGAGKTTLLKCIGGLLDLQRGEVLVDGEPIHPATYENLAFISEEGSLINDFTIEEHKRFFMSCFKRFNEERFEKLIDFFQLDRKKKLKAFSKGQKAKLEIAVGFSKGAKYILMDEPFLGNDVFTRSDFLGVMASFIEEGDIIVIATHLLNEIEHFIDRAIFLKFGRVIGDYSNEELEARGGNLTQVAKELFNYDISRMSSLE
ncbi:multidrug ABC transporter ATP-binding protein [Sporanaerobium hydrogeniformans]|uniref:Multidrug ABC transporter ATP-binding protein n=1 Tax=Sporanaerobium hydrogeniformans TaxID=3072179 RepID=A0AC61DD17_9FIRM|nr:ABC transporter ATP-binding protein [Sporanaerobium hydrogeniformans]PHV70477.1 multidrug ABC transporter ATP-binding protein [Sporanaerobium hydrogeniformans]